MFSWTPYALVRIALFFIAGIILALYLPGTFPIHGVTVLFCGCASLFAMLAYAKWKGRLRSINIGALGLFALVLAGYIHTYYSTDSNYPDHFMHSPAHISKYRVRIANQAQEKANAWKVEAQVLSTRYNDSTWVPRSGKVMLYFSKKAFDKPFVYGDVLLLQGSPQEVQEPLNPGEFDYKKFLSYKKIYHQQFLRGGDVMKIGYDPASTVYAYSIFAREWADAVLKTQVKGVREQATASALVLGVVDGLDN